jgi:hypothetical protein
MGRGYDGKGGLAHCEGVRQVHWCAKVGAARSATLCRLCHASGGELEQIQFPLGTSQFKPPNGTLGARSEVAQPSMIALGSSRTLDVAEPVVEGLPTTPPESPLTPCNL